MTAEMEGVSHRLLDLAVAFGCVRVIRQLSVEVAVIQHDTGAHRTRGYSVPIFTGQVGRRTASVGTVPPTRNTPCSAVSAGATIARSWRLPSGGTHTHTHVYDILAFAPQSHQALATALHTNTYTSKLNYVFFKIISLLFKLIIIIIISKNKLHAVPLTNFHHEIKCF